MDYRANKITFFASYYDAYKCLENADDRLAFIDALLDYAFLGKQPDFDDKLAGMFLLLKPNIDKSIKNIKQGEINGSKGGAPNGNQNARKKTTQGLNEYKTDKEKDEEDGKGNSTGNDGRESVSSGTNIDFEKIYSCS